MSCGICHNNIFPPSRNSEYVVMSGIEQRRVVAINHRVLAAQSKFIRHIIPFSFGINVPLCQSSLIKQCGIILIHPNSKAADTREMKATR